MGLAWLEQVFNRFTKEKARRSWRLLIIDGHGSHLTMRFIDYCDKHRILLAVFPPHSTQTLQPLDVVLFSPLAHFYSDFVTQHLHDSRALEGVPKANFFMLFWRAWQHTMLEVRILSSFEATGIWPQNADAVLNRWHNDSDDGDEDPPAIEADDWRAIDRLYKAVVGGNNSEDAKQLRRTLHHLSARCKLLTAENKGLATVIASQKPQKKKRGALPLPQPSKQRSEALLYSPSKVHAARQQYHNNETQRLEDEVAKYHRREEKAATALQNKLEREKRSAEHKKRVEARRIRRAEEAAEQERKKRARNAAKAIQLPQSGKRKASQKPPPKPRTKQRRWAGAVGGGVAEEPAPAPRTTTTRSGRTATQNY